MYCDFIVNDALEKKLLEGGELKAQLEAELQDKLKKMEKEFENSVVKAAGERCCKTRDQLFFALSKACTVMWHKIWLIIYLYAS